MLIDQIAIRPGRWRGAIVLAVSFALLACSPPPPVRLGFVGGLSGRVADLGVEGRNGATLAVELRNKAGGVNGRRIELLAEDDEQSPDLARRAATRLTELKVDAIVGPMTSAMAAEMIPIANAAHTVMVAPTVSTKALSGIDDYFFRVVSATDVHAKANADYHFQHLGLRRVAAAYDLSNRAYTESWLGDYSAEFTRLGGEIVERKGFTSSPALLFADLASSLLASRPDGVLIVANSVDAAMLCQHLRRLDPMVPITTSEWAATEQLVELGGRSVEGIVIAQLLDRQSTQKAYLDFKRSYSERFGKAPGFGGLTAFDATNVILDALSEQKSGQDLKQVLLTRRTFSRLLKYLTLRAEWSTIRPERVPI